MDFQIQVVGQIVVALSVVAAVLGCVPNTVPTTTNTKTQSYLVDPNTPGAVIQFRVDPRTTVRGPVVHVDGDWNVRVQKIGNSYLVYVAPRGARAMGAVHVVAGPHDDVRLQVGRPPLPAISPAQPATMAPPRATPPIATTSLEDAAPKPATEEKPDAAPEPKPATTGSARDRLRSGTLDTSNPWAP